MPKVQIGNDEVTLQEFSTYKAFRAMRIVKDVLEEYPELASEMEAYSREYERSNVAQIPRAAALFRFGPERLAHLTDEDWAKSGDKLELPRSPGFGEVAMHMFPRAFELAQEQAMALCALVVLPNSDLEEADESGGDTEVDELIKRKGKALQHKAFVGQSLELLTVASEMTEEQIGTKITELRDRLGNVRKLFGLGSPESAPTPSDESDTEPSTDPSQEREASPTKPQSSSSSDAPSPDGTGETSSTEPDGSSRSSSVPA